MRTTIVHALAELASLHTRPPFACGLRSFFMTKPTMSLQGQAEQPMVLRGWGVSSTVPDAPVPWPWIRVAGRVWFAAGRLGSKRSRTSAQLCGMLAWWAPGHGGVAVPSAMLNDIDSCGPPQPPLRPGTGRGRDQRPAAPPRVFGLFGEVAGRGECPAPALFTRSKRQISRAKRPVRPSEGLY